MNWIPVGSPLGVNPLGTEIEGRPAPFPTAPMVSRAVPGTIFLNSWSMGEEGERLEGATIASKGAIASSTTLQMTPLSLRAFK